MVKVHPILAAIGIIFAFILFVIVPVIAYILLSSKQADSYLYVGDNQQGSQIFCAETINPLQKCEVYIKDAQKICNTKTECGGYYYKTNIANNPSQVAYLYDANLPMSISSGWTSYQKVSAKK